MSSRKQPQKQVLQPVNEDVSLVQEEVDRYAKQVNELLTTLEGIPLNKIADPEDRLKAAKAKMDIELKLPTLINELENLRNKAKLKQEDIKGNKNISLLEGGQL